MIHDAVLEVCDSSDGVRDGVIEDPRGEGQVSRTDDRLGGVGDVDGVQPGLRTVPRRRRRKRRRGRPPTLGDVGQ